MSRYCRGVPFRFYLLIISLQESQMHLYVQGLVKEQNAALPSDSEDSAVQTLSTFVT